MSRIRKIEISNFRGLREFSWLPSAGINCLIGPGDSGKSTVLEAIDLCLGPRRTAQFTDADFYNLNVEAPISISVTFGELDDALKNMDSYGPYLRGFRPETGDVEDEPEEHAETVLTLVLTVAGDLEPTWSLFSDRAAAQNLTRNLNWADRVRIGPTRIGPVGDYNLGWRRGSVLNQLSEERADATTALAKAARDARTAFGEEANEQLAGVLTIVKETATDLGIPVGDNVQALLDAHSVSITGGTISLHDDEGVPLRGLGLGSTRLLVAGLQRKAAERSTIVLIDEVEHGLEPHRIIRFLGALGSKDAQPPLQAFITTHSPVVLRELSGQQLYVIRHPENRHEAKNVGIDDAVQGTIRTFPDAFLATSVIICEGATEVGFVRGIDQYRAAHRSTSIGAFGVALVDGGGDTTQLLRRARTFRSLDYRTAVLRDDDVAPDPALEGAFTAAGGTVIAWRTGRALEEELFLSLSDDAVAKLIEYAVELYGDDLVDAQINSASNGHKTLAAIRGELQGQLLSDSRTALGNAAKSRSGWFKTVSRMEHVAREIAAPDLANSDTGFVTIIDSIFNWASERGA